MVFFSLIAWFSVTLSFVVSSHDEAVKGNTMIKALTGSKVSNSGKVIVSFVAILLTTITSCTTCIFELIVYAHTIFIENDLNLVPARIQIW